MYSEYLEVICQLIKNLETSQAEGIKKAAALVGDTIIAKGLVYTFGSGHSQLLAQEIFARAGGMYPILQIIDPFFGRAERLEGIGELLLLGLPLNPGETIFVISNSGRNPEPIEIAMKAKERGLRVIVVTSLAHSKIVTSRHSSGKKLYEFGDVVLDTGIPVGDACMSFKGIEVKAGAASTTVGAALMNAVMVEAIQYILDKGETPPILMSANLDGNEEYNLRIKNQYPDWLNMRLGIHT